MTIETRSAIMSFKHDSEQKGDVGLSLFLILTKVIGYDQPASIIQAQRLQEEKRIRANNRHHSSFTASKYAISHKQKQNKWM